MMQKPQKLHLCIFKSARCQEQDARLAGRLTGLRQVLLPRPREGPAQIGLLEDEKEDNLEGFEEGGNEKHDDGLDQFDEIDDELAGEDEVHSCNNLHLAGNMSLKSRIRPSLFKKKMNLTSFCGMWLEHTISEAGSYAYNTKSESRVGGEVYDQNGRIYTGQNILDRPNWAWQDQLERLMATPTESRICYMIYDLIGANGKSEHTL